MESKPDDDFLPLPEAESINIATDFSDEGEDEDMDDFNTELPAEPDTNYPRDEGDVVGGEDVDID